MQGPDDFSKLSNENVATRGAPHRASTSMRFAVADSRRSSRVATTRFRKVARATLVRRTVPPSVFASRLLMQMYITSVVRLRNAVGQGRSTRAKSHEHVRARYAMLRSAVEIEGNRETCTSLGSKHPNLSKVSCTGTEVPRAGITFSRTSNPREVFQRV